MQIIGEYLFNHNQQTVWNLLMDPQAIAKALPGVQQLVPIDGEIDAWRADAQIDLATVRGHYGGEIRLSEQSPIDSYRLAVKGIGQNSIFNGAALMRLSYDADQQQTAVRWEAEVQVSGKLASIGQQLVGVVANVMSKQFFQALDKQLPP